MSSTVVFIFGILSLSISALATSHISKRRATAKEKRHRTRPLILPWVVSGDLTTRRWSDGHSDNYPIIIDLPSKPYQQLARHKDANSTVPPAIDSVYPSYTHPTSIHFPPSADGGGLLGDNLKMYSPTVAGGSRSPYHYNAEEVSLSGEIAPKRLSFNSLATKNDYDLNPAAGHVIHPKCDFMDKRDSIYSNRDSISSISSTVYSRDRDSVFGVDEFQKLEFVIGSGHRLQAQYGTLSSPSSKIPVPVLTPVERAYQFY